MVDSHWDFVFEIPYQSTDESDIDEGAIDPESDGDEVPVNLTRKPWKSHAPTYRKEIVCFPCYGIIAAELTYSADQLQACRTGQTRQKKESKRCKGEG